MCFNLFLNWAQYICILARYPKYIDKIIFLTLGALTAQNHNCESSLSEMFQDQWVKYCRQTNNKNVNIDENIPRNYFLCFCRQNRQQFNAHILLTIWGFNKAISQKYFRLGLTPRQHQKKVYANKSSLNFVFATKIQIIDSILLVRGKCWIWPIFSTSEKKLLFGLSFLVMNFMHRQ